MDLKLCGGCGWALALNRYVVGKGDEADFLECENPACGVEPQRVVFHADGSFSDYTEPPAVDPVDEAEEDPEALLARVFDSYEPVEILRRAMLALDRAAAVEVLDEFDFIEAPDDRCGIPFGWGDGEDEEGFCTLDPDHEGDHGDGDHVGTEIEKEPIRL